MFVKYKSKKNKFYRVLSFIKEYFIVINIMIIIFGGSFFWVYLININQIELFGEILSSLEVLVVIVAFFNLFLFYLYLPVINSFTLNDKQKYFAKENIWVYSLTLLMLFSLGLSIILLSDFYSYNEQAKLISILIFVLTVNAFFCLFSLVLLEPSFNSKRTQFIELFLHSSLFVSPFLLSLFFLTKFVSDDLAFFKLVIIYILFLIVSNVIVVSNRKYNYFIIFGLSIIFLIIFSYIGSGFKIQQAILKFGGFSQNASQSGWYFVRSSNYTYLNQISSSGFLKVKNGSRENENYIYGYLLLNIGSIKLLCPESLEEQLEREKENKNKIFKQCQSFPAEELQFMGETIY